MPYNANFSVTQSIDCTTITVHDISSNPDDQIITDRKLYLQKADGTYIAPESQTILVGATNASCSYRFSGSIPTVGSVIKAAWQDPVLGFIEFPYTIQSGDVDIPTLSANFCAAQLDVTKFTFVYNSGTNLITITAPNGYGNSINYSGSGTGVGFLRIVDIAASNKTNFSGGSYGTPTVTTGLDYWDFNPVLFPTNYITIPLAQDFALSIQMTSVPDYDVDGAVYVVVKDLVFTCNLQTFRLARISDLSSIPSIINDANFKGSLYDLSLEIDNAGLAINVGDIQSSQAAIDRGYNLVNNKNNFF